MNRVGQTANPYREPLNQRREERPPAEPVRALLLTTEEAAKALNLSKTWLEQLRSAGRGGPKFVRLGRAVRYRPEDLTAWLEANLIETKAA